MNGYHFGYTVYYAYKLYCTMHTCELFARVCYSSVYGSSMEIDTVLLSFCPWIPKNSSKKKEQHTMQWMKYKMNYVTIDVIIGFNQIFVFYDNCK